MDPSFISLVNGTFSLKFYVDTLLDDIWQILRQEGIKTQSINAEISFDIHKAKLRYKALYRTLKKCRKPK